MKVTGLAAMQPKSALQPHEFELPPLGPKDALLEVTHCGICHSDIHLIDNDWTVSQYPLVPGHEVIGKVERLGEGVEHLKPGQRVGVGWLSGTCLECEWCSQGEETSCFKQRATCVQRPGGYAPKIVVDSRWAFRIPDALDSAGAAPLMCGGLTVFTPLREWAAPTSRVGVIGIGGLGHLALQFARAMGCEVTAFSTSPDKKGDVERFGTRRFVLSTDPSQMKQAANSVDVLISTLLVDQDWDAWIRVLRPKGTLVIVGASPQLLRVEPSALLMGKKGIRGSVTGGRARMREMLNFAARHGIHAQVEALPLTEANAAIEKVRQNRARYRMVLQI